MLSFMLNVRVKPGCTAEAVEALSKIDSVTQDHPGKITFMWFQHLDDPQAFTLIEQWESQEALDQHIPRIIDIWDGFTPYLDGEPQSIKLTRLAANEEAPRRFKHIALFSLKEEHDGRGKAENIRQMLTNIEGLRKSIPTLHRIEASEPYIDAEVPFPACDLVVFAELLSREAYLAYMSHPAHREAAAFAAAVSERVSGITYVV